MKKILIIASILLIKVINSAEIKEFKECNLALIFSIYPLANADIKKINELLAKGADVNCRHYNKETPLMFAVSASCFEKGNKDIVKLLLKNGAKKGIDYQDTNNGSTALMHASTAENNEEIVEMLINAGANLNMRDNTGNTALILAAHFGNKKTVEILMKAGANFRIKNKQKHTALMAAEDSLLRYSDYPKWEQGARETIIFINKYLSELESYKTSKA